ncbi:YraN family protein [Candidatus Gracilibacteria bacterium]|nr:YraN family protein [Candidatus Gracilibacteria bacterium]
MQDFQKNFGNTGEQIAERFLRSRGLEILAKNFHAREGEVDIVARDGETIIFVEVKARRNQKFGSAIESVDERKLEKIAAAGERFLQKNSLENSAWRVDVIAIDEGKLKWIRGV